MPSPVYIDFVARGMTDVGRAFKTVKDTVVQNETASTTAVRRASSEKERAYAQLAREAAKWQRQQLREAESAIRAESRAVQQGAATKARIREASATLAGRMAEREAAAEIRAAERVARERDRIRERSASMAGRYAAREAASEARVRQRQENRNESRREAFATAVVGAGARGVRNAVGMTAAGAQRLAGTVLGLGGGATVADALQERVTLERKAALLSNSAYLGKGERPDVKEIMTKARAASVATGMDAGDLVEATQAYVAKSADFKGGMANMQFFGKLAKGTGTNIQEVAKTAGILRVQNKDLDEGAMKQMLLDVVMQGKQGAVEFSDLAKSAGKITRTSSSYAGSQTDNQRKLLGLAQIGIRTSGSVDESATVLSNISADAMKHSDKVGAVLGKDFLNSKGQISKAPEEFLADVMEKSGGNMQKIQSMGFGMRSMKMFQALAPVFDEAEKKALGEKASPADARKAGRTAVLADMKSVTSASYSEKDLEGDFATVMKTSAEQFEGAVRQLKDAVADKLVPELVKLIPVLQQSVPAVSLFLSKMIELANWAQENHIRAAIAVLGASITKEVMGQIVSAKIGESIKALLTTGGSPPGVGGSGGATGGVGAVVAGGITAQVLAAGDMYSKVTEAQKFGADKGSALAQMSVNGTAGEKDIAGAEVSRARASADGGGAAMWADRVAKGAALLNPATLIGGYASDKITEGLGFKSEGQRSMETTSAQAEVAAYDKMQRELSNQTTVLRQIASNTAAGGGGGINQAARTTGIINR